MTVGLTMQDAKTFVSWITIRFFPHLKKSVFLENQAAQKCTIKKKARYFENIRVLWGFYFLRSEQRWN